MRTQGFTLPELLTALAIVYFLLLASHPIGTLVAKQRLSSGAKELASTLRFARSKAVITQSGVTVLAINGSWSNGWQVFLDPNRNALQDQGEDALANRSSPLGAKIFGNTPVASYVHYSSLGAPELINGGFQAGSIFFCAFTPGPTPLKMTLNSSGRVRVEEHSSADCPEIRQP